MKILVLNAGSSSQKSALFDLPGEAAAGTVSPLWAAKIDWSTAAPELQIRRWDGASLCHPISVAHRQEAIERMLGTLWLGTVSVISSPTEIEAVGHRIVHGGHNLEGSAFITPDIENIIADAAVFAPLHNRAGLEGIQAVKQILGAVPQIAVFDTGFHRTIPRAAAQYPGPYDWFSQGIRKYGFHGINHQYCANRAAQLLNRNLQSLKIISCHLGNGCSLAAIRAGQSVDTTMGFTPLEGLMMGTRSGSLDPGILTYFMRQHSASAEELDEMLNKKSGMLAISGISADMREVRRAIQKGDERARLAFDMFVHRLQAGIGALAAILAGFDVLIFSAGIGENSPEVRASACANLQFLGVNLDSKKNEKASGDEEISVPTSEVRVLVIQAQEDWAIAQACQRLMGARRPQPTI